MQHMTREVYIKNILSKTGEDAIKAFCQIQSTHGGDIDFIIDVHKAVGMHLREQILEDSGKDV